LRWSFVQGDSLERILAAGPVDFEQAKSIVAQVGQALLEAQKVGLVHRDVAPKNILVSASGDVKVINFPLAVPINDRVSGVAAYLSPEQVQGKPVDQRSNTYSLAAILYHLLTGEPPFHGASVQAVLDMQVSTPVLPPTQRRPGANLPPTLTSWCSRRSTRAPADAT
jgi:serine/threonine protein kinase